MKKITESYRLAENITNDNACKEIKSYTWPYVRDILTDLINEQNKWDDNDENNACVERIPLDERISEMRKAFYSKSCSFL